MKITYLSSMGRWMDQSPPVRVVTENVEDILNIRVKRISVSKANLSYHKCGLYLQLWFEDLFTEENLKRCHNIFSLVAQKATSCEYMENDYIDFYCEMYYEKPGTFRMKRKTIILELFKTFSSRFLCYDPDKGNSPKFTLRELLTDDTKYKIFLDYWENLENYETKRNILSQVLCKDVVDKILTMY